MTKTLIILGILSVVVVAAGKPAQDDVSAELKRLRGSWRLVDEIDDGRQMPQEEAQKNNILTFEITGSWKVEMDGKVVGQGTAKSTRPGDQRQSSIPSLANTPVVKL